MTIEKCRTCKHAFTTGKDRVYCKKSLADKDDCGGYEMTREKMREAIKALWGLRKALEIIDKHKPESEGIK